MSYLTLFVSIVLVMSVVFYLTDFEEPMNTYSTVIMSENDSSYDLTSGIMLNPGEFIPKLMWNWAIANILLIGIGTALILASAVVLGGITNPIFTTILKVVLLVIFWNFFINPIIPIFSAFDVLGPPWNWAFFIFMNFLMIMAYIEVAQGGSP